LVVSIPRHSSAGQQRQDYFGQRDADGQLTEIGHYCREALQEFVEDLVKGFPGYEETKKMRL
jgi:hypothetical protein